MKKLTITIDGNDYTIANTIKSQLIFENSTNKVFQLSNLTDVYTYYYCILVANNENIDVDNILPFDKFLAVLDEEPELIISFNLILENKKKE